MQSGTLDDLRDKTRTSITVATARPVVGLDKLTGVHSARTEESRLHFVVEGDNMDAAMAHLAGFGIRSLVSQPPTLEELFMREYGDDLDARDAAEAGSGASS